MPQRTVWIDGTGLLYRAWNALPSTLRTQDGLPTNAVYGFAQMFRRILRGRTPTYGAVVFDAPGGSHRRAIDPNYKRHRPKMPEGLRRQIAAVEELVDAHGFPRLSIPGVEADDVLATLCTHALEAGHEVTVVSGDKDLLQLLTSDAVRVFDPTAEVSYHADRARRRMGVLPTQLPDFLALAGDAVDGIAGVPGIGKKTAVELLQKHPDLESVLNAATGSDRIPTLLRKHAEAARRCKQLATVLRDVAVPPLTELAVTPPTLTALNTVYQRFEFYSLLTAEPSIGPLQYYVCDTAEMATAALANECCTGPVAIQVLQELDLLGTVAGIALSPREGFALYFPFRGEGPTVEVDLLRAWLEDETRPKITHDAKQVYTALLPLGVTVRGVIADTQLASFLLDPTRGLPHRLEQVSRRVRKRALQPLRGLLGKGRAMKRFDQLTIDRAGAYTCHLADAIGGCWRGLEPELLEDDLLELLAEDLELSETLAAMELRGMAVDPSMLQELGQGFEAERETVAGEIHALAGHAFNIGSPKQLGTVLFDELGLPVLQRTKTGYSTAASVLERLDHPIVAPVQRWRTLDTLLHTYTTVLVDSVRPTTGRIHCTFQQTASSTGRLITTAPDLQRTPVRSPEFRRVREAFVAPPGHVLLSADWSHFELRILAHLTGDPELLQGFRSGADLHRRTAAGLFDLPENQVSPGEREIGKTVNFATLYGQGPVALAQQLDIPHREAKTYIERFFELYRGVLAWRERTIAQAHADGFVTTLTGRRRMLPELSIRTTSDRAYGERLAMNTPVQGSAADLCKAAMRRIAAELNHSDLRTGMVLQIHDELLFEVPKGEIDVVTPIVQRGMTEIMRLEVPLEVSIGVGGTWADAHPD